MCAMHCWSLHPSSILPSPPLIQPQNSHKYLPHYRFNPRTGEWRHRTQAGLAPGRRWLASCDFMGAEQEQGQGQGQGGAEDEQQDPLALWGARKEVELFDRVGLLLLILLLYAR